MKHLGTTTELEDIVSREELAVKVTVGTTAPSSPSIGDIWIDTN